MTILRKNERFGGIFDFEFGFNFEKSFGVLVNFGLGKGMLLIGMRNNF